MCRQDLMGFPWIIVISLGIGIYLAIGLVIMMRVRQDLANPYSIWREPFTVIAWPRIVVYWIGSHRKQ